MIFPECGVGREYWLCAVFRLSEFNRRRITFKDSVSLYVMSIAVSKMVFSSYLYIVAAALLFFVAFSTGCKKGYAPKPYGYPRIERDSVSYVAFCTDGFPVLFDIPSGTLPLLRSGSASSVWLDIHYPMYRATLYCTYIPVGASGMSDELAKATEFVYLHASKASSIDAVSFEGENASATIYRLYGKVATPIQFVADDGSRFLLRGALYFDSEVEPDSVAPVVDYIEGDVKHLVESLKFR